MAFIRTRWRRGRGDRHRHGGGGPGQPWPPEVSAILATATLHLNPKKKGEDLSTFPKKKRGRTWWFRSNTPPQLYSAWCQGRFQHGVEPPELPLLQQDLVTYAPSGLLWAIFAVMLV